MTYVRASNLRKPTIDSASLSTQGMAIVPIWERSEEGTKVVVDPVSMSTGPYQFPI